MFLASLIVLFAGDFVRQRAIATPDVEHLPIAKLERDFFTAGQAEPATGRRRGQRLQFHVPRGRKGARRFRVPHVPANGRRRGNDTQWDTNDILSWGRPAAGGPQKGYPKHRYRPERNVPVSFRGLNLRTSLQALRGGGTLVSDAAGGTYVVTLSVVMYALPKGIHGMAPVSV